MAPVLAELGAVIVGAVLPKTTLVLLKPPPTKLGIAPVTVKVVVVVLLA